MVVKERTFEIVLDGQGDGELGIEGHAGRDTVGLGGPENLFHQSK